MATSSSRGGSQSEQKRGNGGVEPRARRRAVESLSPSVFELYNRLEARLHEHPYQTLAVVAGAGFILGGGLFTRLAGNMIGTALRLGIAGAITPLLDELAAMAGQSAESESG